MAAEIDWREYYRRTEARPPRPVIERAFQLFDRPGTALDLGCGGGRETLPLLAAGWRVTAIDAEPAAVDRVTERAEEAGLAAGLTTQCARFEDLALPPADLIISSFALPLCPPGRFGQLWRNIEQSLLTGAMGPGVFAGHLFGDRDEWASDPDRLRRLTFHTRHETLMRMTAFHMHYFVEEEDLATTPRGTQKQWHIFHITARIKPGAPHADLTPAL